MADNQSTPLRFAILGCGRMGRVHARRLHADGRSCVVALFDSHQPVAAQLRDELGLDVSVETDVTSLLNREDVDAAIVCTPTTAHFDQVTACRQRGWHVLCEKPLADTRERIVALIDAANQAGPVLSVAYQRRYWSTYSRLREEVQSGRWGAVKSVTSQNCERWQQTIAGTWRDDPSINPGGFITDAGSHKIDALFFVTGLRPIEVFASSDRCGSHVEIVADVVARLEGGVRLGMSFIGHAESFREDLHVHCEQADLLLRDGKLWLGRDNQLRPIDVDDRQWGLDSTSNPVTGFLDLLHNGGSKLAPAECALPVFDFTDAILRSSRSGQIELV